MANKPFLLILGGVALGSLLVGGLVGAVLYSGGGGGSTTPTAVGVTPLALTPTPTPGGTTVPGTAQTRTTAPRTATRSVTPTRTPTATPTPVPTATPSPTPLRIPTVTPSPTPGPTTVPPSEFDPGAVEAAIVDAINDRRAAANESRLDSSGAHGDPLTAMARDHSAAMADAETVAHEIDGRSSKDRYEEYSLYLSCRWSGESGRLVTADDNELELVGSTVAGRPYEVGGERRFNGNETAVARAIVESWWYGLDRDRMLRPGADEVGVGVEITRQGEVYATANFCG